MEGWEIVESLTRIKLVLYEPFAPMSVLYKLEPTGASTTPHSSPYRTARMNVPGFSQLFIERTNFAVWSFSILNVFVCSFEFISSEVRTAELGTPTLLPLL